MHLYDEFVKFQRGGYDIGLACRNGHGINGKVETQPQFNAKFCPKCGEETLSQCECGEPLRGGLLNIASSYNPPAHCTGCGKAYIWTERKTEALKEYFVTLIEIEADEKAKLLEAVPDIVTETPRTPTAIARIGSLLGRVTTPAKDALVDLLKQVAAAAVLKKLGLD
jgi:hypothetical protein